MNAVADTTKKANELKKAAAKKKKEDDAKNTTCGTKANPGTIMIQKMIQKKKKNR